VLYTCESREIPDLVGHRGSSNLLPSRNACTANYTVAIWKTTLLRKIQTRRDTVRFPTGTRSNERSCLIDGEY
jgi:hypothetical protein